MSNHVRLGVIMLCHAELATVARMARIWIEGGARVALHLDAKVPDAEMRSLKASLADLDGILYSRRHHCDWGRFNLVRATQDAAETLLETWPDLTHVYLASGLCLPLRPLSDLIAYLGAEPDRDHIESVSANEVGWTVGGLNEERFTLYFPFDWQRQRWLFDRAVEFQRRRGICRKLPRGLSPHLGSQWWCLTARTLRAILQDPDRARNDRFFRLTWIPDESYFQTLVRRHSVKVESQSLTLAQFDHSGRPYLLYDDHILTLEESRCFVARKIWPGARRLLDHFPRKAGAVPDIAPPEPARFERVFSRASRRRTIGRPGLYMQSRFPRKDAENGKTSAPYAVFQGPGDLFVDFETWLAQHVSGDVHGHLLGAERVEFAGRPQVGPGAISSNPQLRDHDPQGFLTALIRITQRMQIFQFSPRDNQSLNWFMMTDPNAHFFVVSGAWMVPLLHSGMPFDDIRRITAHLQWAEQQQLNIINSVWVRARIQHWELSDFLARPQALMDAALRQVDLDARPVVTLPAMQDLSGLAELLRKLRNSGLKPRVTGELPASDAAQASRAPGSHAPGLSVDIDLPANERTGTT